MLQKKFLVVVKQLCIVFCQTKKTSTVLQHTQEENGSDNSEDSGISQCSQISVLEQQHQNFESNMSKMMEEITRLKSKTEHLTRRCDSLQTQLRMVNSAGR